MKYYKFLVHGVQTTHFKKDGRTIEYTDWFSSAVKAKEELEVLRGVYADRVTADYGTQLHMKPNLADDDVEFICRKLVTQRVK